MSRKKVRRAKTWASKAALKREIRKCLDREQLDEQQIASRVGATLRATCDAVDELLDAGKIERIHRLEPVR